MMRGTWSPSLPTDASAMRVHMEGLPQSPCWTRQDLRLLTGPHVTRQDKRRKEEEGRQDPYFRGGEGRGAPAASEAPSLVGR